MAGRPLLQNLVKEAIATSAARVQVTSEANLQAGKTAAEEKCAKCGKEKDACTCPKTAAAAPPPPAGSLDGVTVEKLAAACDYAATLLRDPKTAASLAGPYGLTEHITQPPPGVSQATASTSLPDHKGQGVHTVPMHPGEMKTSPKGPTTAMVDTQNDAPQLHQHQMQTNYGKHASAVARIRAVLGAPKTAEPKGVEKDETEGLKKIEKGLKETETAHASEPENKEGSAAAPTDLVSWLSARVTAGTKQAEDAINPAQISAGKAVPPQTSAAGEAGGAPAGGAPQGPTGLVASNDSARHYTKGSAYANRKVDLRKYFAEPALSGEHDSVLQAAFSHTGQAGTKFASAEGVTPAAAAARTVLFTKLAEAAALDPPPAQPTQEGASP